MSTRARSRAQRGFTLLEVLIALAIAGIGLIAAFRAAGIGVTGVQSAAQTVAAVRHAEAHLAELGTVVPLRPGEVNGVENDGYRWRVRVTMVDSHPGDSKEAPARTLYAVESEVTWSDGGRRRSVRLDTIRTGRPPMAERAAP